MNAPYHVLPTWWGRGAEGDNGPPGHSSDSEELGPLIAIAELQSGHSSDSEELGPLIAIAELQSGHSSDSEELGP